MKTISLEKDILQYGLFIGIAFQLYQSAFSFAPAVPVATLAMNLAILFIMIILVFTARAGWIETTAAILHAIVLTAFFFFWKNYGGLAGTVPSFICIYTIFCILASRSWVRWVCLGTMAAGLLFFLVFPRLVGMEGVSEPGKIRAVQRAIDYVIVAGIIAGFLLYMKNKFFFYRTKVARRFHQMSEVANTLQASNKSIAHNQEEIRVINENLESIVLERIREIENKNRALEEYAFINAHKLRGPLCRIKGIIQLMEMRGGVLPQVSDVKALAKQIDEEIRKINNVIG